MRFFYANNKLATLSADVTNSSVFRIDRIPLALSQENCTSVIASDPMASPHYILSTTGLLPVAFSPYGASTVDNLTIGFKGEHSLLTPALYLLGNGYRGYNPTLMRFNSPDLESPFARGGPNSYTFVLNDPVNKLDPTGRFFQRITSNASAAMRSAAQRIDGWVRSLEHTKTYQGKIVAEFDGIVAFTGSKHKPGRDPTLYISAHGRAGAISGNREIGYSAQKLFEKLETLGLSPQQKQMHILACDSAVPSNLTGTSFIEDLAKLTSAQVSGYDATILITEERTLTGTDTIYTAQKRHSAFERGTTGIKTRAGNIRNPHKLS
ncbi:MULTISPECIES: RHS repeat-associated core domain-containing protein [unclassified Pseudomonas]|uniref:RHS repeat-associated core domain-containing protein n=1 Tax=unclassified Pseudomonas TaxID=196821 RepID=UPI0035C0BA2F